MTAEEKLWTDADRLALKPKNDPPHPCYQCQRVKGSKPMIVFWAFYPPTGREEYLNLSINGSKAYYGTIHRCFPCKWACGERLWLRPAMNGNTRIQTEVKGEHVKEHWCDNRRLIEGNMTLGAEERLRVELKRRGITREQYIVELQERMDEIKFAEERRKETSRAKTDLAEQQHRDTMDVQSLMPDSSKTEKVKQETVESTKAEADPVAPPAFFQKIADLEEKYEWLKEIIDDRHVNQFLKLENVVKRLAEWTHLPEKRE